MFKKFFAIMLLASCTGKVVYLEGKDGAPGVAGQNGTNGSDGKDGNSNDEIVAELLSRLEMNEELDSMQSALIQANSESIASLADRVAALEEGQENLSLLIEQERIAREAGDETLADSLAEQVLAQQAADAALQAQIDAINSGITSITSSLSNLQTQINNTNTDISELNYNLTLLQYEVADLEDLLDDSVEDLQEQIDDLKDQLDDLPSGSSVIASNNTCQQVSGNYYMKADKLYNEDDTNRCDGNNDKVNLSNSDSFWISATKLAVKVSGAILVFSF